MRGCNTARATREHTEQRRDHILHENLSGASWLAMSGGVAPQLTCRRLGLRRLGVGLRVIAMWMQTNTRRTDEDVDVGAGKG